MRITKLFIVFYVFVMVLFIKSISILVMFCLVRLKIFVVKTRTNKKKVNFDMKSTSD